MNRGVTTLEGLLPEIPNKYQNIISAILDRDRDIPYTEVLKTYGISANQFGQGINHDLDNLIKVASGDAKRILEQIASDENRKRELFRMGEKFIREQYLRVMGKIPGETQKEFYQGTLLHPENIDLLAYYALTYHNPQLASTDRTEVVEGITRICTLKNRFRSIKLAGVMNYMPKRGEKGSPLAVLRAFDRVYQMKTGDASLFDLDQEHHIHPWRDNFVTPAHYWDDPANVEEFVYHTLTEHDPKLGSLNRAEVTQGIKNLPTNLQLYFYSIGFELIMRKMSEKGGEHPVMGVMTVFNEAYKKRTEDYSLFDKKQGNHIAFDARNRLIR